MKALKKINGRIPCNHSELNLRHTLLGGQSFRWTQSQEKENEFSGVVSGCFWLLRQEERFLYYKAIASSEISPENCDSFLEKYFRLEVNLKELYESWSASHFHFKQAAHNFHAVRVLNQNPVENVISFICSQNNHIKRISHMVEHLSQKYGKKICRYNNLDYYSFPSLEDLDKIELESELREANFGYRAKFLAKAVKYILTLGGEKWLNGLSCTSYEEAKSKLLEVPGIGPKIADCICLMSLNHLDSIPVDTHIFKIAKVVYMPNLRDKSTLSRKTYDEIANNLRAIYGKYAGWAQAVLFCSDLKAFREHQ